MTRCALSLVTVPLMDTLGRSSGDPLVTRSFICVVTASQRRGGDGAIYTVTGDGAAWVCTCPARSHRCSHLLAVRRVVAVDVGELLNDGSHP